MVVRESHTQGVTFAVIASRGRSVAAPQCELTGSQQRFRLRPARRRMALRERAFEPASTFSATAGGEPEATQCGYQAECIVAGGPLRSQEPAQGSEDVRVFAFENIDGVRAPRVLERRFQLLHQRSKEGGMSRANGCPFLRLAESLRCKCAHC